MDTLFLQPLDIPAKTTTGNTSLIPTFLCVIEGWKTKIKNLHWSADNMNTHKLLDEIADFVNDYQDSLAEDYMGINAKFDSTFLKGITCNCSNTNEVLKEMQSRTRVFYEKLPTITNYSGIKSETETFIHNINKYLYLIELCK